MESFSCFLGIWLELSPALNLSRFTVTFSSIKSAQRRLGIYFLPMTSIVAWHCSFQITHPCMAVVVSRVYWSKMTLPFGDPWLLVGPRSNDTGCSLALLATISRTKAWICLLSYFCVRVLGLLTLFWLEREWYCFLESCWIVVQDCSSRSLLSGME